MENKCSNCAKDKQINVQYGIDEIVKEPVPYIVYESAMARNEERHKADMARNEREKKLLWILVITSWIIVFLMAAMFTYERLQYDYTGEQITIEGEQDGSGVNIIGGGNVDYGAESKNNNQQEKAD